MFTTQLFKSERLLLDAYDPEKDAALEAPFSTDFSYSWQQDVDEIPHPMTVFALKKKREEQLKEAGEKWNAFYFAVRRKEDNQFLGVIIFPWVFWVNRDAGCKVLLNKEVREEYFSEALELALRYGFEELQIHHLYMYTSEFEPEILAAHLKAGMKLEVRQRRMVFQDGKLWDRYMVGMLQRDWQLIHNEE